MSGFQNQGGGRQIRRRSDLADEGAACLSVLLPHGPGDPRGDGRVPLAHQHERIDRPDLGRRENDVQPFGEFGAVTMAYRVSNRGGISSGETADHRFTSAQSVQTGQSINPVAPSLRRYSRTACQSARFPVPSNTVPQPTQERHLL